MEVNEKMKRILRIIYIGQTVHQEGLPLYQFNRRDRRIIRSLSKEGFVTIGRKSRYQVLRTTDEGSKLGSSILKGIIGSMRGSILKVTSEIPCPLLGFLFYDWYNLEFDIEKATEGQVNYWEEFFFNNLIDQNKAVWNRIKELNQLLLESGIFVRVSRCPFPDEKGNPDQHIIIPDEFGQFLSKNNIVADGLDYYLKERVRAFFILSKVKDLLKIEDREERRDHYWALLQDNDNPEHYIESIINTFSKDKITSSYRSVNDEDFLFEILDGEAYDKALTKKIFHFIEKIARYEKKHIARETIKISIHPRLFNHAKAYTIIGEFELSLRTFILRRMCHSHLTINEMLKEISREKVSLYQELLKRQNRSKERGESLESELLYYADIMDYKNIMLKYWEPCFKRDFERKDISKEKLENAMMQLNSIRNRIMHLRNLPDFIFRSFKLQVLDDLEAVIK